MRRLQAVVEYIHTKILYIILFSLLSIELLIPTKVRLIIQELRDTVTV